MLSCFSCLFVPFFLIVFDFLLSAHLIYIIFCSAVSSFSSFVCKQGEWFMQQYSKTPSPTSDVKTPKACQRRFNAKSNVHSLSDIRTPETFSISVCYESVLALSERTAGSNPPGLTDRSRGRLPLLSENEGCIFHRPQSCAFFYAI